MASDVETAVSRPGVVRQVLQIVVSVVVGVIAYLVVTQVALLIQFRSYNSDVNLLLVILTAVLVGVGVHVGFRSPRLVLPAALVITVLVLLSAPGASHFGFDGPVSPPLALFSRGAETPTPLAVAIAAAVAALEGLRAGRPRSRDLQPGRLKLLGAVAGLVTYLAVTELTLLTWVDTYPIWDTVLGVLLTAALVAVGVHVGTQWPELARRAAVAMAGLVGLSAVIGANVWLDEATRLNPLVLFFVGAWTTAPLSMATGAVVAAIHTLRRSRPPSASDPS